MSSILGHNYFFRAGFAEFLFHPFSEEKQMFFEAQGNLRFPAVSLGGFTSAEKTKENSGREGMFKLKT
jgi:hypothetical protein